MATGFSFGAKPSTPSFGQPGFGAQPSGSITFGTPVSANPAPFGTNQPSTGFGSTTFNMPSFGTPSTTTQSAGLAFGAPATSSTGFAFGAAPASSVPNTGLAFGMPASTAPATNTFGFGAPATASTGLTFGTPATASGGLSFGTPATASGGLTFGTPATASGGLTFGTPATASSGLTFGTPATSAPAFPFGGSTSGATNLFGTPVAITTTTTTPSLGFGSTAPSTGLGLGQTQTTASGLFGGSSFAFGAPTTATSAPTLNLGFGTTTTTSAAPMFNLSMPSSTASTGLSFGLGTTTQAGGLSFGLGGTTNTLSLSKPITTTASATQPTVGLGGILQSTPKSGATNGGKADTQPRDQQLPNELVQTVENLKNLIKYQKTYSSDISKCSIKEFKKVQTDIEQTETLLTELQKQLQNSRALAEKLKMDTAKGLQHIEMAQRTMDTPSGLQYDNTMPLVFFKELVDGFEKELQSLKMQIEIADKYVKNLEAPMPLNSQDLSIGMKRLHDTFIALSGRVQTVHAQVENQKEQYLNFRKYMLNDESNIFEISKTPNEILNILTLSNLNYKPPSLASGPNPFNSLNHSGILTTTLENQPQPAIASNGFGISQPAPAPQAGTTSLFGNTTSLNTSFGQPSTTLQFNSPSNTGFQLQKPPSGNKRGKQIT